MVKTLLNPQIRLDQAVLRLFEEMTRFIDRIAKAEMKDQITPRRMLSKSAFFVVRSQVASWALLKVCDQWDMLAKKKDGGEALGSCTCGLLERFALPCQHTLEYAYDEDIPIPLTLIHPRWWYNGPIQERDRWRPHYGHELVPAPTLRTTTARATITRYCCVY